MIAASFTTAPCDTVDGGGISPKAVRVHPIKDLSRLAIAKSRPLIGVLPDPTESPMEGRMLMEVVHHRIPQSPLQPRRTKETTIMGEGVAGKGREGDR